MKLSGRYYLNANPIKSLISLWIQSTHLTDFFKNGLDGRWGFTWSTSSFFSMSWQFDRFRNGLDGRCDCCAFGISPTFMLFTSAAAAVSPSVVVFDLSTSSTMGVCFSCVFSIPTLASCVLVFFRNVGADNFGAGDGISFPDNLIFSVEDDVLQFVLGAVVCNRSLLSLSNLSCYKSIIWA